MLCLHKAVFGPWKTGILEISVADRPHIENDELILKCIVFHADSENCIEIQFRANCVAVFGVFGFLVFLVLRTDWTELARFFQQTLYQLIFDGDEYVDYVRQTVADLYAGKFDDQLVYRKRLRKKLSDYQKNVPPHAQAAIKAEAEFKRRGQPSRYRNRSWIEYVITVAGAQTLECQNARLDYDHYVDKQLTPIADTILTAIGSSMDAITRQQQDLF